MRLEPKPCARPQLGKSGDDILHLGQFNLSARNPFGIYANFQITGYTRMQVENLEHFTCRQSL